MSESTLEINHEDQFEIDHAEALRDYELACLSRETSLRGRSEVVGSGRAKFGIFGDGKEIAQIAMAKSFERGDFRSGYYRDQTLMMALGECTPRQLFAALYAHTDPEQEPSSSGRQMNCHFSTPSLDAQGQWRTLTEQYNSSSDVSPTAAQMPRLLGLAQASKIYREHPGLQEHHRFSRQGREIAFGTIGDASTSEGMFWETMNAAAVLQVPLLMSVWDDGYGISVSRDHQTVKSSISEALSGFEGAPGIGIKIYRVKGWDYFNLISTYRAAATWCRQHHAPALVHVEEVTQPQGHSTSGSHTRYKSRARLDWEGEWDGIKKFGEALVERGVCTPDKLKELRRAAKSQVEREQREAWRAFRESIEGMITSAQELVVTLSEVSIHREAISALIKTFKLNPNPLKRDVMSLVRRVLHLTRSESSPARQALLEWRTSALAQARAEYSDQLYCEGAGSALNVARVDPIYGDEPSQSDGRVILRDNFAQLFTRYPELMTFGEDTGQLGGVNQAMEGMQARFGDLRVSDTGIRECTIIGQGIGLAMRGLKPIAEIQYLDYIYYALQIMRDDLATVRYRTRGRQHAPLIIRTRGHRLEGIWHSGSPMGAIIHSVRGMHVCVPRDMTRAAGMYNTLLRADDPAIVIECLNGYRAKEDRPQNLGEFTIPLGIPETLRAGHDLTLVSYGATLKLCKEAAMRLQEMEIEVELIDIQTLLPFDIHQSISASLRKTNRLLIVVEDVPGGASAYLLDQILKQPGVFFDLDGEPKTLSAQPHLPAYGSDGDYFSKPSIDDIVETAYEMMHEVHPARYPQLF